MYESYRQEQHSVGGQVLAQHLDGDLALVLEVHGEIHRRHAASPEFALDPVAVGQGGNQARGNSHGTIPDQVHDVRRIFIDSIH